MISESAIARITGILFLLIVPVAIVTVIAEPAIDTRAEWFRGSLQDLADKETGSFISAGFGLVMSLLFVATGAALYVTFRSYERFLSLLSAFGFLAAGVTFMASIVANLTLFDLADEFGGTHGVQADQIVPAARAVGVASDFFLFLGLGLFGLSLLALGILIIWRQPLPRWLGWGAAVSGILIPLALVWLLVAGGWLVWRGTNEAAASGAASNIP